jgi:hypothetical protein
MEKTRDQDNLPFRVKMELSNARELVKSGNLTKKGYDMLIYHYERMGYNLGEYRDGKKTTTNDN